MSPMTLKHLFKNFGTQIKPPPPLFCVKHETIISDAMKVMENGQMKMDSAMI